MTSKEISKPLVSTIISTKNEGFNLTRLITSIKSQTYPNIEIVVVDNHSSDKTVNIARKFGARVYIRGPERSAQRNYGVIKSQGKYVLILDADMELTPNVIAQCVKLGESGLGGMIIPEKSVGEGFWAAVKSEERSWYLGDDSIEAERFFNKAILLAAGGYDESITGPEDWDLPLRTRKLAPHGRIKSFIIHHEGRQYFWKMVKKKYYYGLSLANYVRKNDRHIFSSQQIYFLRPSVIGHTYRIFFNPIVYIGVWILFFAQTLAGVLGYLRGKT